MGRIKVNLTLDAEVAATARALGLNMSRLAEAAIAEATKAERNRLWREENRAANAAYAEELAQGSARYPGTLTGSRYWYHSGPISAAGPGYESPAYGFTQARTSAGVSRYLATGASSAQSTSPNG